MQTRIIPGALKECLNGCTGRVVGRGWCGTCFQRWLYAGRPPGAREHLKPGWTHAEDRMLLDLIRQPHSRTLRDRAPYGHLTELAVHLGRPYEGARSRLHRLRKGTATEPRA